MSDDQVPIRTRRALLAGAGAAGAAVVLSACGGSDGDGDATTSPGPAVTNTGDAGGGDRQGAQSLARTTDIPVGGGAVLAAQGIVITQPSAGEFRGFDPRCPHQGCNVSNVDGGTINCLCHNSKFSIEDGAVQSGPSPAPLAAKNVKVEGDQIQLA
ncbi:Rieske (2Fe-2S) protein [Micromonospora endophytica]|uniref:Rieske (2Fe-2S) protein n=1 Tax=Micromonospora endophytica TaxID=515350 RepID=A0A2W2DQ80_9ACTN|nr:Rieske (2Fe-2S) protein [Micromonospora endophytica]PZF99316.1 Rieske (2Fe-2S) protein [Micromonospora endophytica]RIW43040.1 Rieske (2Fe-2S) protein [Micromonospora endophytica]BCJ61297.1 iron-sulfur protein [Micromonospora endophytica]